ncbi:signal transduction histidine-protein kinase/phosphatase DegS [Kordia sp. SMS9]|uniref:sensor histidine kinase n=1 Tax=Kordia sp. SMS9 TaxID=2282170 RepID=UPI000E0D22BE|nr:sensor histidine kinase [Kordia sp. SMS9]AXG72165.1 signal transduction histidine-protein kinase/phosphatase DegS [Kordia sp. SMS9]
MEDIYVNRKYFNFWQYFFLITFLSTSFISCQKKEVKLIDRNIHAYILHIKNERLHEAFKIINITTDSIVKKELKHHYNFLTQTNNELHDSIKELDKELSFINTVKLPSSVRSLAFINKGDFYIGVNNLDSHISFENYVLAYKEAKKNNDTILICESLKKILFTLYKNSESDSSTCKKYIDVYKNFIYDATENTFYNFYYNDHLGYTTSTSRIKELKKVLKESKTIKNTFIKGKICQLIGIHYNYFDHNQDSSLVYNNKAIKYYSSNTNNLNKIELHGIYNNIGMLKQESDTLSEAVYYFYKALKIELPKNRFLEKEKVNGQLSELFEQRNMADSALYYLKQKIKYSDILAEHQKAISIIDINTRYETAEKDKEIIAAKLKSTKKTNQLIISLAILFIVIISAYLLQKNTRKKQLFAEQAQDLEAQKVKSLLQEQELASIDAMIAGQEKERQRIAEDLHDDLGGLMATINLHIENVSSGNNPNALDKTKVLLNEAYEKIRNISHVRNAGVMANKGLLVAVKNMAQKVNDSNKIHIEVIDFGLNERLENSLELSLFRIIQELITNIIKHAEASKATIQLTQHNYSLNIIVEDNGKGFNLQKKSQGIGLHNIKQRIEHLKGEIKIDSTHMKGATIIVDIPYIKNT